MVEKDKSGIMFNEGLSPFYIKVLPISDGWEGNYRIYSGKTGNGVYNGIEGCTDKDIVIVSYRRDGKKALLFVFFPYTFSQQK